MSRFDTTLPQRALPTIEADGSVMDAIACMVSYDAPAVVVSDRGRGLGVFTEADLRRLASTHGGDAARTPLRQLLRPAIASTRPQAAAARAPGLAVTRPSPERPRDEAPAAIEPSWTTTRWVEA